ncbi:MAG: glycosyltransferase family 2 protein [Candidatus Omnitrophica bacterium]|nr:glycosyltransferase family 2 protein [Candidatus Omnitrophota bacterium]
MRVAVVIPAYQEQQHIESLVVKVKAVSGLEAIYVVDDGSVDKTADLATAAGAIVIKHEVNMGVGAALRSGFSRAQRDGADIIVVMGGDNQDNPNQISRLVKPISEEGYDLVQGSRWLAGGSTQDIPLFRRVTTKIYASILSFCTGFSFTDGTNGFRAFKVSALEVIKLDAKWLNRYELEPYILYKAVKLGLKIKEVGVTKSYFIDKGYTKMIPVVDWWRILRPIIFLKFGIKK